MNKNTFSVLVILTLILVISCNESKFDSEKLLGSWKVAQWKIEKTEELRNNKMDMEFRNDGKYEIDYGSEKETGKFWITNEFLHTVEVGQSEKKVKIIKLTNDTLEIQMNRSGEMENVLLINK
jgi:hypothetical protein